MQPIRKKALNTVKEAAKKFITSEEKSENKQKALSLIKQGKLIELAIQQNTDLTWKSYALNLKKGTLKFITNATIDCLPTNVNLVQWGKRMSDKCPQCGARQTLAHTLNNCKTSLEQGRWTFRHDSIIKYIDKCLDKSKYEVYVDLDGSKFSENSTIPPQYIVTTERPDIVIIDKKTKEINIYELTCPFETNIDKAHAAKIDKYNHFRSDIEDFSVNVEAFEIGSRGYVTPDNRKRIKQLQKYCKTTTKIKKFIENLSAISVNCSYFIFLCRNDKSWPNPPLLSQAFR